MSLFILDPRHKAEDDDRKKACLNQLPTNFFPSLPTSIFTPNLCHSRACPENLKQPIDLIYRHSLLVTSSRIAAFHARLGLEITVLSGVILAKAGLHIKK